MGAVANVERVLDAPKISEMEAHVAEVFRDMVASQCEDSDEMAIQRVNADWKAASDVRRQLAGKVEFTELSRLALLGFFGQHVGEATALDALAGLQRLERTGVSARSQKHVLIGVIGRTYRTGGFIRSASEPEATVRDRIGKVIKGAGALVGLVTVGHTAGTHPQDRPPAVVRAVDWATLDKVSEGIPNNVVQIGSRQKINALEGTVTEVGTGKVIRSATSNTKVNDILSEVKPPKPTDVETIVNSEAAVRSRIVDLARQQLGVPYVFGAENAKGPAGGPGAAEDCSALTQLILTEVGVENVPRIAREQQAYFPSVIEPTLINRLRQPGQLQATVPDIEKHLQIGDLVMFWFQDSRNLPPGQAGHVGIYIGNGMMIDASSAAGEVIEEPVIWRNLIDVVNPLAFGWQTSIDFHLPTRSGEPNPSPTDDQSAVDVLSGLKPPTPSKTIPHPVIHSGSSTAPVVSGEPTIVPRKVNDPTERDMASMWRRHGDLIYQEAHKRHINVDVAMAFLQTEAGGNGFNSDGSLKIRFEDAWFKERTGIEVVPDHSNREVGEYATFAKAKAINVQAAYESISMGAGQIMGGNYGMVGYKSAKQMFEAFSGSDGEVKQIQAMFAYIDNKPGLLKAVQQGDAGKISELYNGKDPRVNPVYEHDIEHYEATFHDITTTP